MTIQLISEANALCGRLTTYNMFIFRNILLPVMSCYIFIIDNSKIQLIIPPLYCTILGIQRN